MTAREALAKGASRLAKLSPSAYLDSVLLLAHALSVEKETLYASLSDELEPSELERYFRLAELRASGESVAYLTGFREFYGRRFIARAGALVPRPETELLVETALEALDDADLPRPLVHDAYTGSGCVAISLALERPAALVSASDISGEALAIARENAEALEASVSFTIADTLPPAGARPFDLVLANPPYIRSGEIDALGLGCRAEPRLALDGGPDGLDHYRRLLPLAARALARGGVLAVEIGDDQGAALRSLFLARGFERVEVRRDLSGRDRVVAGRLP